MTQACELLVDDLHVSFDENHVLRGIDIDVSPGELVALVGGSGCGKTVLLQCILGHVRPQQGRVLIADHEEDGAPLREIGELTEKRMNDIRRHWAVVFQRNALLSGSVLYNLSLWLREIAGVTDEVEILRRVEEALRSVGFEPSEDLIQRERDELSGGMQKRVAVARALVMDPILMFLDEPTTGLDPALAEQVHQLIRTVHERRHDERIPRTTLIITHDKDLLYRLEPRVVMLNEGVVAFDGPYNEFAGSDSPVVRPYFDLMPELHARQD
jgi:phospholipid/cholesterol/gamma-HCH transport system ATP-binding protein